MRELTIFQHLLIHSNNEEITMNFNHNTHLSTIGKFRAAYNWLRKNRMVRKTPIIFCEGDSWFSTPLAKNLLDQVVFPRESDFKEGKVVFGYGGLFYRAEKSGDIAVSMFAPKRAKRHIKWIGNKSYKFDLVLLSAGGNDFVDDFLQQLFENESRTMSVDNAFQKVLDSERYEEVFKAYKSFILEVNRVNDSIPIIAHSYDYPQALGRKGRLTVRNAGLAAVFKKEVGDWIHTHIKTALPDISDQKLFAKKMIDGFFEKVLVRLKNDRAIKNFSFVDLRDTLKSDDLWFDEMHPTSFGFKLLSEKLVSEMLLKLPNSKVN